MSDILVKGMKMPKHWEECKMGYICPCVMECMLVCKEEIRHKDCPLVEVPEHGRLIDADAFIEANREGFREPWCDSNGDVYGYYETPMKEVIKAIEKAPTIISGNQEKLEEISSNSEATE